MVSSSKHDSFTFSYGIMVEFRRSDNSRSRCGKTSQKRVVHHKIKVVQQLEPDLGHSITVKTLLTKQWSNSGHRISLKKPHKTSTISG